MNWVLNNANTLIQALGQHLILSLPPIILATIISIPISWYAHRKKHTRNIIVTTSALLYTIPSLPLFLLLPAILGTGRRSPTNIIIALTLYGIAIILPATVTALRTIQQPVHDAAIALGHSATQLFLNVELPQAGPAILASLRVVTASSISLATLGSVLGVSGLGTLFIDGFKRGIQSEIITGLVLTLALALTLDLLLVLAGRITMPWTHASTPTQKLQPAPIKDTTP